MDFTITTTSALPFDATVTAVRDALADQGFGVLTEIDIAATLHAKIGETVPPQLILGACNPQLAHRALQSEPRIGALLPCNVVVRQDGAGTVLVEALDPAVMVTVSDQPDLRSVADDAGRRLRAALDAVPEAG